MQVNLENASITSDTESVLPPEWEEHAMLESQALEAESAFVQQAAASDSKL